MNKYDEKYEIRLANENDIDSIMTFIDEHWKKNHILAVDRELFKYEYLEEKGRVNFILAIDKKKGTIEAINGVIKASHDTEHLDVWDTLWKSLDGNMAFLGVELLKREPELLGCRTNNGVGDNPETTIPLMKLMKSYTSKMTHFYMLSNKEKYMIAKIDYRPKLVIEKDNSYKVKEYVNIDEVKSVFNVLENVDCVPYKDYWYINHRYYEHPYYKYNVYGIEKNERAEAIFVLRMQEYNGRMAARIVDYIGNQKAIVGAGSFFSELLGKEDIEYIDFYCNGFQSDILHKVGFSQIMDKDKNIIPNYFEPFVQENIEIYVSSSSTNAFFTKADSDQDRPNKIII